MINEYSLEDCILENVKYKEPDLSTTFTLTHDGKGGALKRAKKALICRSTQIIEALQNLMPASKPALANL